MDTGRYCSLCLGDSSCKKLEPVKDITREVLDVVFLNLSKKHQHAICKDCSDKILAAFDFKVKCLDAEDIVFPYICPEGIMEASLKDIYLKEKGGEKWEDLSSNSICRLCMELTNNCVPLKDVPNSDMIKKYLPEMSLSITKDPVVCEDCLNSFVVHSNFLRNCLNLEKQMKSIHHRQMSQSLPCIKNETIEIQSKNDVNREQQSQKLTAKKKYSKVPLNGQIHACELCNYKSLNKYLLKSHKNRIHKDFSELRLHHCEKCSFATLYSKSLANHQFIHKNQSELPKYRCDKCSYKTIKKVNLAAHKRRHERPDRKVKIYKCNECGYEGAHAHGFKRHLGTHKNIDEVETYKCAECNYESHRKDQLNDHLQVHKNPSERKLYQCDVCKFQSKTKKRLRSHQVRHKDPSTVEMFKCSECKYKSPRKDSLKRHMRKHKDLSELGGYKCDECDFKTKSRDSLKSHSMRHKDRSELQIYKCSNCNYESIYRGAFRQHLLVHEDSSKSSGKDPSKAFKCDICEFTTYRKHSLRWHQRTHKK